MTEAISDFCTDVLSVLSLQHMIADTVRSLRHCRNNQFGK